MDKKYRVKLNSTEKVEELLQEIYDQACRHINEIDNEINKIINSTNLGADTVTMEEKAKYAKAVHDFIGDKSKAIQSKLEIAKFMGEIIHHNGDINATVNDKNYVKKSSLKLEDIKAAIKEAQDTDTTTVYNLKSK
jgi:hypothetical protein